MAPARCRSRRVRGAVGQASERRSRVGSPTAWALLASPTCRPNGPVSTRCWAFLLNSCTFEPRLFEPKSPFPGNGISRAETKAPRSRKVKGGRCRDRAHANNPANSALVADNQEISADVGMRGGLGRTRTSNQSVMRQRSAIARLQRNHIGISIR